jgi:YggT family protein
MDLAALVLAWLLSVVELMILALLIDVDRSILGAFGWAIPSLVELFINLFLFAVLLQAVLSWVNPDPYNPVVSLLDRLTSPLMWPARRLIRPIGGIDLSPMLVMIGLILLNMLLIPPLKWLFASPF